MKIWGKAVGPDTGMRARGLYLTVETVRGRIIVAWPRKRGKFKTPFQFYQQSEFAFAASWASDPEPLSYATALSWVTGSDLLPRDILLMCAYGNCVEWMNPDGTLWWRTRSVNPNPQYILDMVTDQVGAMLYRSPAGWVQVDPGNNGQVLSIFAQVPQWQDVYPVGIANAEFILGASDPTLPNGLVVNDSNSIFKSYAVPGELRFKRAALIGDVTAPLDSNTTTIPAQTVTYSKIQNISATKKLLARKSTGAGSVEEASVSEALDFLGPSAPAQGQVPIRTATGWQALDAGADNLVLTARGPAQNPVWAAPTGGGAGGPSIAMTPYFGNAGVYLTPAMTAQTISSSTMGNNIQYWFPINVPWTRAFTLLAINVITPVVGSNARFGIYGNDTTTGGPNVLLLDCGVIATGSAGFKFANIAITLTPGTYWLSSLYSHNIAISGAAAQDATASCGVWMTINPPVPQNGILANQPYVSGLQNPAAPGSGVWVGGLHNQCIGIR